MTDPTGSWTDPLHEIPSYGDETVWDRFSKAAERWGSRRFFSAGPRIRDESGGAEGWTFEKMRECAARRRRDYERRGFGHGDRVGLCLPNSPEYFIEWLALNSLGISAVPINPDLRGADASRLVEHSEMRLAVVAPPCRRFGLAFRAACESRRIAVAETLRSVPEPIAHAPRPESAKTAASLAEAALMYTSGTTGLPKGCVLSNEYFLAAGDWYASLREPWALLEGAERMLTPLPLYHMNAMAFSSMAMIATGGCLVALDRFHPGRWRDDLRESRATIVHYLGIMPAILMKSAPSSKDRDHGVRFGFGAGVNPDLHAGFEERFGYPLIEAWAMTETGAGACIAATGPDRIVGEGCFGRPGPEIETKVVGERGEALAAGTQGELLVRRAGRNPRFGFFSRYLKDEGATREAWRGGWFHTGDIVAQDSNGQFVFKDRKKNMIRRSGENVSAAEVESVLVKHPGVEAVAVGAVPDEIRGEEVACLVKTAERSPEADCGIFGELFKHCIENLAYFKAPGWFASVPELPLTGTEKIQRAELKVLLLRMREAGELADFRSEKKRNG
ncbi:MAG: AMP-binding protein [Albidovulum sp.]|nr:AMP-binding protein [Albidovulum sp.]